MLLLLLLLLLLLPRLILSVTLLYRVAYVLPVLDVVGHEDIRLQNLARRWLVSLSWFSALDQHAAVCTLVSYSRNGDENKIMNELELDVILTTDEGLGKELVDPIVRHCYGLWSDDTSRLLVDALRSDVKYQLLHILRGE